MGPIETDAQVFGLGLAPGADHYRAYVGPPADYDLIAAQTLGLLFAAGLRETHKLLDLGCGSLRAGRLLIPYLRPSHYYGIDPNRWLVEEGIEKEVGRDLVIRKNPAFLYVDDFSADGFGTTFDFVLAQSIFSHTHADLARHGFAAVARVLAPSGVLLATYVDLEVAGPTTPGTGWLYPACVSFEWPQIRRLLREAGLVARRVDWPHPRQRWVVAGLDTAAVERIASTIRSPHRPTPTRSRTATSSSTSTTRSTATY